MPQNGQDWPLVEDMVTNDHRLIVFTLKKHKQESEGIAYEWNYMVENQCNCSSHRESSSLRNETKSLVLVNHFRSVPKQTTCVDNSADLVHMLDTCYGAVGNRSSNFVVVDYYKRSDGGGAFQAADRLNGKLLSGCDDVHACVPGSASQKCTP